MNLPVTVSREMLAMLLRDMAARVEANDSWEGSIEWTIALEDDPNFDQEVDNPVMVRAAYRVGNSMGQGGMRIVGTMGGQP